jgi:endonuclease III
MSEADGSAFSNIPSIAVNVEDLNTAVNYIMRLQDFADFLINTRMSAIKTDTVTSQQMGTPFGNFDDAVAQWSALKTATNNATASLTTVKQKLATLKAGTETIIKNYKNTEDRNATTQAQIDAIFDQSNIAAAKAASTTPNV